MQEQSGGEQGPKPPATITVKSRHKTYTSERNPRHPLVDTETPTSKEAKRPQSPEEKAAEERIEGAKERLRTEMLRNPKLTKQEAEKILESLGFKDEDIKGAIIALACPELTI